MMRKSLLIAALGAVLPMFMSDVTAAAAAPLPPGDVPATLAPEAGMAAAGEPTSAASASSPSESANAASVVSGQTGTAVTVDQSAAQTSTMAGETTGSATDAGNAVGGASDAALSEAVISALAAPVLDNAGESPNAAPAAVESTTEPASAPSADGADTTSTIAESSAEPLHVRVAQHLEAIYSLTRDAAEQPVTTVTQDAVGVKQHIAEVLHSIQNGIDVRTGELVQKLEALFHKL